MSEMLPFDPTHGKHPPVRNAHHVFESQLTFGQRAADVIARSMGSWGFIIGQTVLLAIWIVLNVTAWIGQWDPYPFILMNLVLSTQAAFTAPVIMMSQNRQAEHDRVEARIDYDVNLRAEAEVRMMIRQLQIQTKTLNALRDEIEALKARLGEDEPPQA
jgi:uncharacterized membrane protein